MHKTEYFMRTISQIVKKKEKKKINLTFLASMVLIRIYLNEVL